MNNHTQFSPQAEGNMVINFNLQTRKRDFRELGGGKPLRVIKYCQISINIQIIGSLSPY